MNSTISDYFGIIEKVEPAYVFENFGYDANDADLVTLEKDFEIDYVIKIPAGEQFIHFVDETSEGVFHDMFSRKKF